MKDTGPIWAFIVVFDVAGTIFLLTVFVPRLITFWNKIKGPIELTLVCGSVIIMGLLLIGLACAHFFVPPGDGEYINGIFYGERDE